MNCRKFKRLWSARLPGGLPPAAQTHLSSCPACTALIQAESAEHSLRPLPAAPLTPSANSAWPAIGLSRRGFIKASLASLFASLTMKMKHSFGGEAPRAPFIPVAPGAPVEYIVVGSGGGGGPLACNLAKAGHKVVLFEAGGDDADDIASVPFFSAFATEDERIQWNYFVRHYENNEQQQRDSKYIRNKDGVWYPRVGSLGGCTVHSFLVEVYPSNSDWDHIAAVTGDHSWSASNMRKYFERFEQCRYVMQHGNENPSRHGFDGWQPTEIPVPVMFARDFKVLRILKAAAQEMGDSALRVLFKFFGSQLDPNDWRFQLHREGIYNIPLFTKNGRRFGPRQLIQQTAAALPNNLIVMTHTLVTRILFEGTMAVGVEYFEGEHLYRADPNSTNTAEPGPRKTMRASREVILSAGAFNSPQLLKLSGIGPKDELSSHGIKPIVDLPGVGENLQDRYEISVVTEMNANFTVDAACTPGQDGDLCYSQWLEGKGPYTGNSAVGAILLKSDTARSAGYPDPDLFLFNPLTRFKGFYPGYSRLDVAADDAKNQFTWGILKAHTLNHAGTVKLRSNDPLDTPIITFHYFDEGSDKELEDLRSVVDGIEFVRRMNTQIADIAKGEVWPSPQVQSRDDIAQFVRDEAWGHHASCTCKMGPPEDPMAVVDSDFRVHGTRNLRVVDASIFPRIPGYFILTPIYMISEKASEVILASVDQDLSANAENSYKNSLRN